MKEALNFKPGDAIRVKLNPIKGHEQKGVRPAIVITHLYQFGLIIIVPLTTKDKGWWTQVKISKEEGGLTKDSFTLCHQIRSLSVNRVEKRLGRISPFMLSKIKVVLVRLLEL